MAEGKDTPTQEEEKGSTQRRAPQGKPWTLKEFGGKAVWDWLQLIGVLAIPVVLAVGGCMFNAQQDARQQQIEDDRADQAQKLEDQRAQAERELADQRAQDEALQAYLGQMSSLLLEKDLRASQEDSEARTLARARTLTVLERLDSRRRRSAVLWFLIEAELVQRVEGREPVISLEGADLSGVAGSGLSYTDLSDANLRDADLHRANLQDVDLSGANLRIALLSDANLSYADLSGANLLNAFLDGADLFNAKGWTEEQLAAAISLKGTTMPDGQILKSEDPLLPGDQERPTFEEWRKDREGHK